MIDFHKLSNYEINNAVHNALLRKPFKIRFEGKDVIYWIDGENESIRWDLLFSDKLGITTWSANMCDEKYFTDKLRAAMIVFLKKQKHIEYEGIYCENI